MAVTGTHKYAETSCNIISANKVEAAAPVYIVCSASFGMRYSITIHASLGLVHQSKASCPTLTDAYPGVRCISNALTTLLMICNETVKIPESHHKCQPGLPSNPNVKMNITDLLPKTGIIIAITIFTAAKAPSFAPVEGQ